MVTRVVLADDHTIMRRGLKLLLESFEDLEVVGEAQDGRTVIELVRTLSPDLVVMDVEMPDLNGIEATRKVLAEKPDVKVLALSMHSEKRFVLEMLKAGARGYLLKDSALEELSVAIRAAQAGRTYLSPAVTGAVIEEYAAQVPKSEMSVFTVLTEREREVLQLLAEGRSAKEVAAELHVSRRTVETHKQHIMDKLEIRSIAELTKYAIREGLTSP